MKNIINIKTPSTMMKYFISLGQFRDWVRATLQKVSSCYDPNFVMKYSHKTIPNRFSGCYQTFLDSILEKLFSLVEICKRGITDKWETFAKKKWGDKFSAFVKTVTPLYYVIIFSHSTYYVFNCLLHFLSMQFSNVFECLCVCLHLWNWNRNKRRHENTPPFTKTHICVYCTQNWRKFKWRLCSKMKFLLDFFIETTAINFKSRKIRRVFWWQMAIV